MVFTSFEFLLFFLPIVVIICYILARFSHKSVIYFLIASSLFFYSSWNPKYLYLLLGSVLFNFTVGKILCIIPKNYGKTSYYVCFCGVISNIILLGYFKYTNFFVDSFNFIFSQSYLVEKIVLPLAISFFTFQQIAWLIDQYRKEAPRSSFSDYCCAVTFFPHLIAGPIVQYHDLIPQIQSKSIFKPNWDNICNALFLIAIGTFKKIVIADSLAVYATLTFDSTQPLNALSAWFGLASYTMQIYFDFSGYCDIALGSALLIGIKLPINFDNPYRSKSIREFWKKWHITLGYFLAKYVYQPMGGSRKGTVRTCVNLLIVMLISGFWHGAGICFILWGLIHGIGLVINRIFNICGGKINNKIVSVLLTFVFTSLAWVVFRCNTFDSAMNYFHSLFSINITDSWSIPHFFSYIIPDSWGIRYFSLQNYLGLSNRKDMFMLVCYLTVAFFIAFLCPRAQILYDKLIVPSKWYSLPIMLIAAVLLLCAFLKMVYIPYTEFIYFNF